MVSEEFFDGSLSGMVTDYLGVAVAVVSMRTTYRRRVLSRIVLRHAARQHTPADPLDGYFRPSCRAAVGGWMPAESFRGALKAEDI